MEKCLKCNIKQDDIPKLKSCGHYICFKCLCNQLKSISSAKILCPVEGCKKFISDLIVRKCLSNEKLELYDKFCYSPNTVKCLIKNCNYYTYSEKEGQFICPRCQQPNCLLCKRLHDLDYHCKSIKDYDPNPFEKAAEIILQQQRKNETQFILENNGLIPNYDTFDCGICTEFFLPREGVVLRNCMHNFCKPCLDGYYMSVNHLNSLSCPDKDCSKNLNQAEILAFIDKDKLKDLNLNLVKTQFFNCQTPECKGLWDFATFTGKKQCEICNHINCGTCRDIHEGISCEEFKKSRRYKDGKSCLERYKKQKKIKCLSCNAMIIKNGGCNALKCPTCKLQICAFSGKEIGPRGCKCTQLKRCAVECDPGCIPEGSTPYELEIRRYFYNNPLLS